jgi:hypothetical protein
MVQQHSTEIFGPDEKERSLEVAEEEYQTQKNAKLTIQIVSEGVS